MSTSSKQSVEKDTDLYDFRGHPLCCPYLMRIMALRLVLVLGQAKITHLAVQLPVDQDIEALEIPVYYDGITGV
jgi:hypothetical protein